MKYTHLTCLLLVISGYSFAGIHEPSFLCKDHNLSDTVPSISYFTTDKYISKIEINKLDPTDIQSKIKIRWDCRGCTEVYIKGLDSVRHLLSGEFETDDQSFSYTLIGIANNMIFTKEISASLAYKKGTGIDGRIYYLKDDFLSPKKKPWKYQFESKKTFSRMESDITEILQIFGYVSESTIQDNRALMFECEPLQAHQKVCGGNDCNRKIGERRIERKLGITVVVEKTGDKTYVLNITPIVMMNYPMQDNSWKPDPDEYNTSKEACDEISKKIIEKLEK